MELHAVVTGDAENQEAVERHGFDWLWWSNERMGSKWNAAFAHAADEGADLFVLIGSDNWLHPTGFAPPPDGAISAHRSIDFVDLERGVLQHASGQDFIPWLIPRATLERCSTYPYPFPDRMQRGTEFMLWGALDRPPIMERYGPCGVDFKSRHSTSPYAGVRNSVGDGIERDALAELGRHYPAHLVEAARLTMEGLA